MELRELFEAADTDKGGALEIEEFIEAFGGVLGKDMNKKQLKQLFMKIDADSNGGVGKLYQYFNLCDRVA
jgi:Ca2+-binding EF-hand superfamily protein